MATKNKKETETRPILGKILITGKVHCLTGLHIGKAQDDWTIGGLDSPVVRDPITYKPYIPGSSFRGKLRCLFERVENGRNPEFQLGRHSGQGVYRHECTKRTCKVCRLFGATGKKEEKNIPSRLSIRDLRLTEESRRELEKIDTGLQYTELKFENALDRVTAAANPRQIERVPAGAEFDLEMVYTVESKNENEASEDLENLLMLLKLVQDDAIGGHGARGYGKIKIRDLKLEARKLPYYQMLEKPGEAQSYTIQIDSSANIEPLKELIQFLFEDGHAT